MVLWSESEWRDRCYWPSACRNGWPLLYLGGKGLRMVIHTHSPLSRLIMPSIRSCPFSLPRRTEQHLGDSCPRDRPRSLVRWAKNEKEDEYDNQRDHHQTMLNSARQFRSCGAALATVFHFFSFLVQRAKKPRYGDPGNCRSWWWKVARTAGWKMLIAINSPRAPILCIDDTKALSLTTTGAWRALIRLGKHAFPHLALEAAYIVRSIVFPSICASGLACCK